MRTPRSLPRGPQRRRAGRGEGLGGVGSRALNFAAFLTVGTRSLQRGGEGSACSRRPGLSLLSPDSCPLERISEQKRGVSVASSVRGKLAKTQYWGSVGLGARVQA